jgi:lipid II:glycine glycyltransferase (peptidoglycan interpeptide bridge formation enzyme)
MDKKWRSNLRKAEQYALSVSQETGPDGIRIFTDLSGQMQKRKQFSSGFVHMLPALCATPPQDFRPSIFVCWLDGIPVASAIISSIGNCAIYLNGANGDAGLEVRAGYFLQWAIIRWLKEQGVCRWYDLHGVLSSPGVRQFKKGLVGAKAQAIPMNEFEACESRLLASFVEAGVRLHEAQRGLRKSLTQLRTGG